MSIIESRISNRSTEFQQNRESMQSLVDDVFGDLLDPANPDVSANTCPAQSTTIAAGDSFTCSFEAFVGGNASDPDHENTVTAELEDDDGNPVTEEDAATVGIDDAIPNITVTKTPSTSVVAPTSTRSTS